MTKRTSYSSCVREAEVSLTASPVMRSILFTLNKLLRHDKILRFFGHQVSIMDLFLIPLLRLLSPFASHFNIGECRRPAVVQRAIAGYSTGYDIRGTDVGIAVTVPGYGEVAAAGD